MLEFFLGFLVGALLVWGQASWRVRRAFAASRAIIEEARLLSDQMDNEARQKRLRAAMRR